MFCLSFNVVINTEKFIKNKLTSKRNKGRIKFTCGMNQTIDPLLHNEESSTIINSEANANKSFTKKSPNLKV